MKDKILDGVLRLFELKSIITIILTIAATKLVFLKILPIDKYFELVLMVFVFYFNKDKKVE